MTTPDIYPKRYFHLIEIKFTSRNLFALCQYV